MFKNKKKPNTTKAEDKVPVQKKALYGLGSFVLNPGGQLVNRFGNIIFNMELGVNPALVGLAITIFRFWDAFTDPLMGNISDNSRFKMGRRRPYIIIGALLCAITFPLIWLVPRGLGETGMFIWFLISCLIFYTAYTVFSVPYTALAMEMTPDYNEKTRVIAWRGLFSKLSAIGMGWVFAIITLFDDTLVGMRWVALGFAIIFLICGVLPGIFIKERFYKAAKKQAKTPLIASIKITMKSKPFRMVIAMVILMILGSTLVNALGDYLNIYYIHGGIDKAAAGKIMGWSSTCAMITSICSIPLYTWLAKTYGKNRALFFNASFLLVGTLAKWVLVTPAHPWWFVFNAALLGPGTTGVWIILPSLVADICDADELETGCRREGSYTSILQWITKMGFSLTAMVTGLILVATGFDANLGAAQAPETLLWMRIFYTAIPTISVVITIFILLKFPLNAKKAAEVRVALEARRGAL